MQCLTVQARAPEWRKGAFKYLDPGEFGALRSYSSPERGGRSQWINPGLTVVSFASLECISFKDFAEIPASDTKMDLNTSKHLQHRPNLGSHLDAEHSGVTL